MTPALTELKRLVAMLETVRPQPWNVPFVAAIKTEAGEYILEAPTAPRAPWTWAHEDAEPGDTPARYGTARTFYDALDEVMGDIDWATCQSCHATHEVEGNGPLCRTCFVERMEEQADDDAAWADTRMRIMREAGL